MNFRTTVMLGVLIIFVTFFCAWVLRPKPSVAKPSPATSASEAQALIDAQCMVIHKPAKGCPPGYKDYPVPSFTEKDGSKQFACWTDNPTKEPCIDVLRGGETYRTQDLAVPHERRRKHDDLPPEPPAPKPAGERKL